MPSDNASAAEFAKDLYRQQSLQDCAQMFRAIIAPFGFDTFACGELHLENLNRNVFYIIDWPERWSKFYRSSGFIERDPIVSELAERHAPFTWSDLRADRKLSKVGREALDMVAAAGWSEGLVVPLPKGQNRFGLVSMAGSQPVTAAVRDYLGLISLCLHSHARMLATRDGFAMPPAGLTPREVDCVRLIAQGLSDTATAKAMGIAHSTAHEFAENAKRKLGVKSRGALIGIAVSLAIVDI